MQLLQTRCPEQAKVAFVFSRSFSIGSTLGVAAHGEPMDVIERQIAAGANQSLKTKNALGK